VFVVGQGTIVKPPVVPQPVTPETSAFGVKLKTEVVATPVMVTVTAVEQELAAIAVVPTVVVVLAMPRAVTVHVLPRVQVTPLTVVDELARSELVTGPEVSTDSFTPSPVAGVAAWRMPAVIVAGSLSR
jgi:hypothetical protein